MVQPDDLLAAITSPPASGSTVEGIAPPHGAKIMLAISVRRNEVQFTTTNATGDSADVAVGLDDFQDALEGVLSRS